MARYKEFKRLLKENGFVIKKGSGKGSHEVWVHTSGVRTTITRHPGDISKYVERSILKAIERSKGECDE